MRVFEVDTPATQRVKRQALDRAGIDASHVTFVETDFGQTSWFDALLRRGFDPDLPTFILWEGVTYYLDEKTVQTTLRTVSGLAVGSRIAFDTWSLEYFSRFVANTCASWSKGSTASLFSSSCPPQPLHGSRPAISLPHRDWHWRGMNPWVRSAESRSP